MDIHMLIGWAAQLLEALGVAVIVFGAVLAAVIALARGRGHGWQATYHSLRERLGAAILLGLELLVGADIIRTVSEEPTLGNVVVLGIIVLIRTFLSFTLQLEIEGHWPWQRPARTPAPHGAPGPDPGSGHDPGQP